MTGIDGTEEWPRWVSRVISDMEIPGPPNLAIWRWSFAVETEGGIPECSHNECHEPPLYCLVGWIGEETLSEGNYEILLVCESHAHSLVSALIEPVE